MDGKLLKRVREAGYEISYDPAQDGNCFYRAAAFHLGIDWQTLKDAVFEHLESNQFDVSCSHTVLYADKLDYVNGLCYKCIPFNQYYHLWLLYFSKTAMTGCPSYVKLTLGKLFLTRGWRR